MSNENENKQPEQPQRKATEILISLESKIDTLTKVMYSYDMNMKITLNRVNEIHSYIDGLKQEYADQIQQENTLPEDKQIIQAPGEAIISQAEKPIVRGRVDRVDTAKRDSYIPPAIQEEQRISIPPSQQASNSDKKVPVVQRITDQTGKDLFMAEVSIFNLNKELVLKTKTSAVGKWQAILRPGKYIVNIVKTDTATKAKLEAQQEITITDSSSTIALPTAIIKR
jgi:small nuclear ribonucleoprotein (snRNP)-like protein